MNHKDSKQDLIAFLQAELQISVDASFRFFDDTGIDGIDAWNLMHDLSIKFGVDLSDFDAEKYFIMKRTL